MYTAGTNGLESLGIPSGPPRITCDGCGLVYEIPRRGFGVPPKWFLDGKAPPGWKRGPRDEKRWDKCTRCKAKKGTR